ncbi:MAG: sugar phosphate isomerase/epimerase [Candidatus Aminicenantes bacterium]|nr:sugar phosphate isomerase/epimerase [Candidatus Aminicenantes bacterium]
MKTSRRGLFKLGVAAASAGIFSSRTQVAHAKKRALKLGVASYSLRNIPRPGAIEMVRALGTPYVNIKSFHLPYETSKAERARARAQFEKSGLRIVGGGVIPIKDNTDDAVKFFFEYAKQCGMPLMAIAPTAQVMPRVEKYVKRYGIAAGLHHHAPEDQHFPAPSDGLKVIKGMDPRVGLCVDVGHTARTGVDVVDAVREAGSRILDMHMKDLRDFTDHRSQCAIGEGKMPVADIFRELIRMGYAGHVNLEYEIEPDNPLPGMKQSFAYMRGVLDGLDRS